MYFSEALTSGCDSTEQAGAAIATMLVTPHIILIALATIFMCLSFFLKKPGFTLTGAILYVVGGILFIPYIFFVIPSLILGFIGYSKQKKINEALNNNQTDK